MRNLFLAIAFAIGLMATPAFAAEACEGNFQSFADNAMEDYFIISGASLDAFAASATVAKPAEITYIAVPADMDDEDGSGQVSFFTFMADNCPYGGGQGYFLTDAIKTAVANAMVVDDDVILLKANPDAKAPEEPSI